MRDQVVNMALRLQKELSLNSPNVVDRKKPSLLIDGQPLSHREADKEDEESLFKDMCPICWYNEITLTGDIDSSDEMTFELSCGHRFCKDCCIQSLKGLILDNKLKKLCCLEASCKQKVSDADLNRLF